jgi:hypothetical protein
MDATGVNSSADDEFVASRSNRTGFAQVVEIIGLVVPPAALLTGLMFYFGWVRTREYWRFFGVEASVLELSVQDYLLRGIDAVHLPLVLIIASWAALTWASRASWTFTPLERFRWSIGWVAGLVGTLLVLIGAVLAARDGAVWSRATSYMLAAGIVAIILGGILRRHIHNGGAGNSRKVGTLPPITVVAAAMLVMLTLFWVFADYAGTVGRRQAERRAQGLENYPQVVLYSNQDLSIDAPGVRVERRPSDRAYPFRYAGLALLLSANDQYILIPKSWRPGSPSFIVPVSEAPRLDFGSG